VRHNDLANDNLVPYSHLVRTGQNKETPRAVQSKHWTNPRILAARECTLHEKTSAGSVCSGGLRVAGVCPVTKDEKTGLIDKTGR
jgi:hypothetical protein